MTSLRFEDLKDELNQLKDRICIKLKQGISESILDNFLSEGNTILIEIKKELYQTPTFAKREMYNTFSKINSDWETFKKNCKTNPGLIIGCPNVIFDSSNLSPELENKEGQFESNLNLVKGIAILEQTSQSLYRASHISRETEQIGIDTLTELGEQRESLLRTRGRLDDANQTLKRSHYVLRTLHRRVITNKLFLYLIIILELIIMGLLIYWKFIKK